MNDRINMYVEINTYERKQIIIKKKWNKKIRQKLDSFIG